MSSPETTAAFVRRPVRSWWVHGFGRVLGVLLVFALIPGSDELLESVGHLLHDGHLPHSTAHTDAAASEDHQTNDEHGCTPMAHHCRCCDSAPLWAPTLPPLPDAPLRTIERRRVVALQQRGPPPSGIEPSLRPPIS